MTLLTLEKINKCIEIVCDGGQKFGFGHIRRSYTLAEALRDCGYDVRYVVASEQGQKLLPEFTSSNLQPDIRILDLPYDINNFLHLNDTSSPPVIALDYFGELPVSCVISIYEHKTPLNQVNRYTGLKYALIRQKITDYSPDNYGKGVIVMIGGSDLNRAGAIVAERIADAGNKVTLIQGPLNNYDYIAKSSNIIVLRTPEDIEKRMLSCAWAVTNGGNTMMEMMYLGKAVHVIPQTDAENNLAQLILRDNGILGIGIDQLRIPKLNKVIHIGKRAGGIIDGQGVNRIIRIINKYL